MPGIPVQHHHLLRADIFAEQSGTGRIADRQQTQSASLTGILTGASMIQGICSGEAEMRRPLAVLRRWRLSGRDFTVARLRSGAALLLTVALLLSVGPNPFNSAPVRGDEVVYDFVANAASASWSSGAGALPFPGSDSDSRGFALIRSGFALEDGSSPSKSLQTHPQWVGNGWIQGRYPSITVPDGAELHLKVGFYSGATGTDGVLFQVQFEEGQTRSTLLGVGAT